MERRVLRRLVEESKIRLGVMWVGLGRVVGAR